MKEYFAIWARQGCLNDPLLGRVAVVNDRLVLKGTFDSGMLATEEIAAKDIRGLGRFLGDGVRLDLLRGGSLIFTAIVGAGTLDDLFQSILQLLS